MQNLVLLVGNPNAGKSTLFNKLTRGHAKVGNWHGVTVGAAQKSVKVNGQSIAVCDLPGIYSLDAMSLEEKLSRDRIAEHKDAAIIFVTECGALPRSLPLLARLSEEGRRVLVVLTKQRRFLRDGGKIDADALAARLGVPVLSADRTSRKRLLQAVCALLASEPKRVRTEGALQDIFRPEREGLGKFDKLLVNGWFCFPFFFALLVGVFYITFAPHCLGDVMKNALDGLFSEILYRRAQNISSPVLRSFVADGLLTSLGGVLGFLPQIALLYLFLILLEESGLLSRLAILTDGAFAKAGLNGRAAFSLLMGFGCTAAAIATTRGLDDKRIQRRVILCLPYISCSAKLPVYLALSASFFSNPFVAVLLLYALGVGLSVFVALFFKDREAHPFVLELAPLQIPRPAFVLKSLLFQIKQFIIKVATVILAFFLASWLLSSFDFSFHFTGAEHSMLATLCGGLKYLFAPVGMNDWRIAYAALSGMVAKENVAGALAMFYGEFPYSAQSAFAFAVFMLATSPCVSAIAATAREIGWGRALLYAAMQTVTALLLSYATYFALTHGAACIFLLPALFAILILGRNGIERVRRKRKNRITKVHR